MNGDIEPRQTTALERFIEKLNLPEVVAGPAGKAISRLVAGALEIPAAFLDGLAQRVKDKSEARSLVNKEVAAAAAKLAAGDQDIVARAAHNLIAKEYRKQKNKEAIATKTIEILQEEPTDKQQQTSENPQDVDEDWLNVFEKYAEDASSERLQELWARVLAGQIRKPRAFSLQTLRFISEIDAATAKLFQKHSATVMADFIPFPPREGIDFVELLELEAAGLVGGVGGSLAKIFDAGPGLFPIMLREQLVLLILFEKKTKFQIASVLLTRVGRELFPIVKAELDKGTLEKFVTQFPKDGVLQMALTDLSNEPTTQLTLWKKTEPAANM